MLNTAFRFPYKHSLKGLRPDVGTSQRTNECIMNSLKTRLSLPRNQILRG
jgi:hypothetical protein